MTDIYQDTILDLYKNPINQGEMDNPDLILDMTNSSCGDSIKIFLKIENSKIADIRWQGAGCVISQVEMSALAEYILENKLSLEEVKNIDREKLLSLLGLDQINPGREKCLMIGLSAFKNNI